MEQVPIPQKGRWGKGVLKKKTPPEKSKGAYEEVNKNGGKILRKKKCRRRSKFK